MVLFTSKTSVAQSHSFSPDDPGEKTQTTAGSVHSLCLARDREINGPEDVGAQLIRRGE